MYEQKKIIIVIGVSGKLITIVQWLYVYSFLNILLILLLIV